MITAIICAVILMAVVAGLIRVADRTGAAVRDFNEKLFNVHELYAQRKPDFWADRKWEVHA